MLAASLLKARNAKQVFENAGTSFPRSYKRRSFVRYVIDLFLFTQLNSEKPDEIPQMDRSLTCVHTMAIRFQGVSGSC